MVEPCETKAKTSKLNTAAHVPRYQFSDSHFFLFVKLRQSNNSYSKEWHFSRFSFVQRLKILKLCILSQQNIADAYLTS